jgi:hypothetical protein
VLAIAIAGKFVGAYIGSRISRLGHWEALSMGAGMNARYLNSYGCVPLMAQSERLPTPSITPHRARASSAARCRLPRERCGWRYGWSSCVSSSDKR